MNPAFDVELILLAVIFSGSQEIRRRIPLAVERIVRKQNLEFMHNRNLFCPEHFLFMKKLLQCNAHYVFSHLNHQQVLHRCLVANVLDMQMCVACAAIFSLALCKVCYCSYCSCTNCFPCFALDMGFDKFRVESDIIMCE